MSAARANVEKRRADEHASETRRATDLAQIQSEDREAENTVAALRAAAQFASQNVKLKQKAAEEQRHRDAASADALNAKSGMRDVDGADSSAITEAEPIEAQKTDKTQSPDNASLDAQPTKPVLAVEKTIVQSDAAEQSEGAVQTNIEQASLAGEIEPPNNAQSSKTKGADGELTETLHAGATLDMQLPSVVVLSTPLEEPTKPESGSATASHLEPTKQLSVNDKLATIKTLTQDAMDQDAVSPSQNRAEAHTKDDTSEDDGTAADTLATTQVSDQSQSKLSDTVPQSTIATTTAAGNALASNIERDPLLSQPRREAADQAFYKGPASSTIQTPTQTASPQSPSQEQDRAPTLIPMTTTGDRETRAQTKFEIGSSSTGVQSFDAPTSEFDITSSNKGDSDQQQKQMGDNRPSLLQQLKPLADANPNTQNLMGKNTVSVQELAKLGVADAVVSIETSELSTATTPDQPNQLQSPLASSPQVQPQTTEATGSNGASNLERRSIAADIRLRALERMVVAAARAGTDTITLQLYPPGLGQVMIKLVMDGQRLRITTRAANAEAVDTLKGMESDLRDALAGNGLNLATFDVTDEKQDGEQGRRQPPAETAARSTGPNNETFTVDLNA